MVMNTGIGVLITGTGPGEMSRITWNYKIELHFLFYIQILTYFNIGRFVIGRLMHCMFVTLGVFLIGLKGTGSRS